MVDQQHHRQIVLNWLKSGAIWKDGVSLFKQIFGSDHPFIILVKKGGNDIKYRVLIQALELYAKHICGPEEKYNQDKPKFREEFPFLSDPACPVELKILAANKITAYHNYINAHKSLFDCETPADQFAAVRKTVENYIENRLILKEFDYYRENKSLLAEHPIFKLLKRFEALKKLTIVDLVKLSKKLEHNIWRIRSEIKKGDKKYLDVEREKAIMEKSMELAEVDRIIKDRS